MIAVGQILDIIDVFTFILDNISTYLKRRLFKPWIGTVFRDPIYGIEPYRICNPCASHRCNLETYTIVRNIGPWNNFYITPITAT